jgi:hypothetical protein
MKRQNLGKINSSNYQPLYLWTSFLLGMISLGIVAWQRKQTSFVIPNEIRDLRNEVHNEIPRGIYSEERRARNDGNLLDSRLREHDNFASFISLYEIKFPDLAPLVLSALTYQQSSNAMRGLMLLGLSSYVTKTTAQSALALTIDVKNLGSNEGIVLTGVASTGSTTYAADLNRDNKTDLLIGAYLSNKMYLAFWPFNTANLESLSGPGGVIFTGKTGTGFTAYAADMNRDNYTDILFGTFGFVNAQTVYLAYGPEFNVTNLDSLSGAQGVVFSGELGAGISVYAADMNGDGNLDLLTDAHDANKVYLEYGPMFSVANLASLSGLQGVVFNGASSAGFSIYAADMNRDGNIDILIGARDANKAYLVYGSIFNVTNLDSLNGSQGVVFTGAAFMCSAMYAADMNGDGNLDILIGAQNANTVYLAYGPSFNVTNLDSLSGSQGVVFRGSAGTGYSVYAADMNGDGNLDILTGALGVTKTYLVYGPNFANVTNFDSMTLKQGVIFIGAVFTRTSNVADMNGDGALDIILTDENVSVYIVYNHVFNIFPPVTAATTITPANAFPTTTTHGVIQTNALTTTSVGLTTLTSTSDSLPIIPNTQNNDNFTGEIVGAVVATCVVGTLFGAVGFFAINKCRNKKAKVANNSTKAVNLPRYQTTPVSDNRYNSARLDYQDQQPAATNSGVAQKTYREIDETKKDEKQYENVPKLEI